MLMFYTQLSCLSSKKPSDDYDFSWGLAQLCLCFVLYHTVFNVYVASEQNIKVYGC